MEEYFVGTEGGELSFMESSDGNILVDQGQNIQQSVATNAFTPTQLYFVQGSEPVSSQQCIIAGETQTLYSAPAQPAAQQYILLPSKLSASPQRMQCLVNSSTTQDNIKREIQNQTINHITTLQTGQQVTSGQQQVIAIEQGTRNNKLINTPRNIVTDSMKQKIHILQPQVGVSSMTQNGQIINRPGRKVNPSQQRIIRHLPQADLQQIIAQPGKFICTNKNLSAIKQQQNPNMQVSSSVGQVRQQPLTIQVQQTDSGIHVKQTKCGISAVQRGSVIHVEQQNPSHYQVQQFQIGGQAGQAIQLQQSPVIQVQQRSSVGQVKRQIPAVKVEYSPPSVQMSSNSTLNVTNNQIVAQVQQGIGQQLKQTPSCINIRNTELAQSYVIATQSSPLSNTSGGYVVKSKMPALNQNTICSNTLEYKDKSVIADKKFSSARGRGRSRGRGRPKGRGRVPEEPVILTLSSDDESEEKKEAKTKDATDSPTNAPLVLNQKEPIIKTEVTTPLDCILMRTVTQPLNLDAGATYAALQCRNIRIGSYRTIPTKKVIFSSTGINIVVSPLTRGNPPVSILIPTDKVFKILVHFGASLPVFFLYVKPQLAACIRYVLGLNDPTKEYFDPSSKDESQKRITIVSEKMNEEAKKLMKHFYRTPYRFTNSGLTVPMLEEISQLEAHTIFQASSIEKSKSASMKNASLETKSLLVFPPKHKGAVTITIDDYNCLEDEQFLNDVIIDFYLKWLVTRKISDNLRSRTHVFSTFFYKRLTAKPGKGRRLESHENDPNLTPAQRRHARVKSWTKGVDIFQKDFIIIPINEHSHWFLAIICFPGQNGAIEQTEKQLMEQKLGNIKRRKIDLNLETSSAESEWSDRDEASGEDEELLDFEEETEGHKLQKQTNAKSSVKQPCILIFDSLRGAARVRILATLREYLTVEYKLKRGLQRTFSKDTMKGSIPVVPQQTNLSDCGIYTLHFAESFFEKPLQDYKLPIKSLANWFPQEDVDKKRKDIATLIKSLMDEVRSNHGINLPALFQQNGATDDKPKLNTATTNNPMENKTVNTSDRFVEVSSQRVLFEGTVQQEANNIVNTLHQNISDSHVSSSTLQKTKSPMRKMKPEIIRDSETSEVLLIVNPTNESTVSSFSDDKAVEIPASTYYRVISGSTTTTAKVQSLPNIVGGIRTPITVPNTKQFSDMLIDRKSTMPITSGLLQFDNKSSLSISGVPLQLNNKINIPMSGGPHQYDTKTNLSISGSMLQLDNKINLPTSGGLRQYDHKTNFPISSSSQQLESKVNVPVSGGLRQLDNKNGLPISCGPRQLDNNTSMPVLDGPRQLVTTTTSLPISGGLQQFDNKISHPSISGRSWQLDNKTNLSLSVDPCQFVNNTNLPISVGLRQLDIKPTILPISGGPQQFENKTTSQPIADGNQKLDTKTTNLPISNDSQELYNKNTSLPIWSGHKQIHNKSILPISVDTQQMENKSSLPILDSQLKLDSKTSLPISDCQLQFDNKNNFQISDTSQQLNLLSSNKKSIMSTNCNQSLLNLAEIAASRERNAGSNVPSSFCHSNVASTELSSTSEISLQSGPTRLDADIDDINNRNPQMIYKISKNKPLQKTKKSFKKLSSSNVKVAEYMPQPAINEETLPSTSNKAQHIKPDAQSVGVSVEELNDTGNVSSDESLSAITPSVFRFKTRNTSSGRVVATPKRYLDIDELPVKKRNKGSKQNFRGNT